jgi:parallel beta-helix repeat protein
VYDFYVDAGSSQTTENGTEDFPFKTIGAALDYIKSNKLKEKSVFIKKGTYNEEVELTGGTDLVGEDRHKTVVNAEGKDYGMRFSATSSRVSNLTIENAGVNVKVDKKSKVIISNCSIKDSGSNGVEVDRSSYSTKRKFTLKNSSVKGSGERGMYIFKRKIEVRGCEVQENGGEGIDLHSRLRGKISGNVIRNNDESGIEMIMAGTKISIKGNTISGNKTQGLAIQVYNGEKGRVIVSRNTITGNSHYGIRYARYDHGKLKVKFQDFIRQCVKLSGNSISGNGSGDYGYL